MNELYQYDSYPFVIQPFSEEEGGGFMISWPDLPNCYSEGDSVAEAIENGRDAVELYMEHLVENHHVIPSPTTGKILVLATD